MGLPAETKVASNLVARFEVRTVGGNHLTRGRALKHGVERLRLRIRLGIVHPPAHVGIEREKQVAHLYLPCERLWERLLDECE